jgi:hypothetical protein
MTISISLVPVACIAVVISARTKPMPCKYDCIISSMGSTSASDIAWATELALTPSKTLSKASSEAVGEVVCNTDVAAGVLSAMAAGIEAGTGVKVGAGVEAGGGDATPAAAGVMNTPGGSCCWPDRELDDGDEVKLPKGEEDAIARPWLWITPLEGADTVKGGKGTWIK